MAHFTIPVTRRDQASRASERVLILEPGRAERHYWRDLWTYRELFAILAWRDLAVRYKQTAIGVAWAVIRPLLSMLIFTVLCSRVAKLPSVGHAPYSVMVFAGMLPWFLFSTILSDASISLVTNSNLISKVYFPRLIVMMAWYRFLPDWRLIFLPFFLLFAVLASLGPALYITALNVKYRDFRYIIPFILQFGLYVSPVGFSSTVVPAKWRLLYSLNPVVGVIDGFRWCLLRGESQFYLPGLLLSIGAVVASLWLGTWYFRKTERTFADLL